MKTEEFGDPEEPRPVPHGPGWQAMIWRGGRRTSGSSTTTQTQASGSPAPRSKPPTVAALTMARDEGNMLRRWVNYYGDALGRSNLIVFDDHSSDGSTDDLGCTVYQLPTFPGGEAFIPARMQLANGIAAGLLSCYDYVIFADTDEFLVPDPAEFDGLLDFISARSDRDVIAGMALNVVHRAEIETGIDPERPILDQRSFAKFIPRMCKPAIKRIPAPWRRSTHAIAAPYTVDPGLFMMHMKFHDEEALRALGDRRRAAFESDARGFNSSWKLTGNQITAEVSEAVAAHQLADVPEFVADPVLLDQVVVPRGGQAHESGHGSAQMKAMRNQPLVRIPERLRGLV